MGNVCHCFLCSALADDSGRVSRGVQHLGLLGIFSTNKFVRLGKSPNWLRYFPPVGNNRSCASIKSVVYCHTLYLVCYRRCFLFECREVAMDGWTKGGIDVVCWSVPSFQHTIYPPKRPSLFYPPLLQLISFSCCCCQYHLKRLVVTADSLHQFPADCPCLIGVQAKCKQQNDLHIIYGDIQVVSFLDGLLCLVLLYQLLFVERFDGIPQLGDEHSEQVHQFGLAHPNLPTRYSQFSVFAILTPLDDVSRLHSLMPF